MKKLILIGILPILIGCKRSLENTIKEGSFSVCPNVTVQKLFTKFLKNPNWEGFLSPDDNKFHLNVSGSFAIEGQRKNMLVQFQYTEGDNWEVNAMEIDGENVSTDEWGGIIEYICEYVNQ